jgi:transcription-repair coupling factor (superfamily II helicase)
VLKKGVLLIYFISNAMSAYYKSPTFVAIMNYIQNSKRKFILTEKDNKLYLKANDVKSIRAALMLLEDIDQNI